MVNRWLTRERLHWMKGGPVLHFEHARRGVWAGPPPPNSSVLARLEADILIGQPLRALGSANGDGGLEGQWALRAVPGLLAD
jgi:hypothetical protein